MHLKKLDHSFYSLHSHLLEALDNANGKWEEGKVRGYGIVVVSFNDLTFAIPLRSTIKHNSSYITKKCKVTGDKGGLDYTKALLITDPVYISNIPYKIPNDQHKKLQDKEFHITKKFNKYVSKYVKAVQSQDMNILKSADYRFTTLINYHLELNLL